ncbi:MAG: putative bifunctional diguanylate cyclase/phosphodiesterase [Armatimonadota bacterium]
MKDRQCDITLEEAIEVLRGLLRTGKLPDDAQNRSLKHASLCELVSDLTALQDFAVSISEGDLDQSLPLRGYATGALKSLQANLRHLTWQTQQVAAGDFDQRVDFMGDFSEAFNRMVASLAQNRAELAQREANLLQANARQQRVISEREKTEEQLAFQARHDSLTKLPNRLLFNETLESLVKSRRRLSSVLAVVFIDLDRFKFVNDTLGHDAGDQLLVETAGRLKSCLRDDDLLCRMGGDEFTAILRGMSDGESVLALTNRILAELDRPFRLAGHEVTIGASFGVAFCPEDATSVSELLKKADTAMYHAKELGGNICRLYSPELDADNLEKMRLERDLRLAIGRGELDVHYQPRIDSMSGKLLALEAMLRWTHPVRGTVPPTDFLSVAENSDLILQLGDFVIKTVCEQQSTWKKLGLPLVPIAVNLSKKQVQRVEYLEQTERILAQHDIDPSLLVLETSGNALFEAGEPERAMVQRLRTLGTKIVLDGFGTDPVPFFGLVGMPIDYLKIDCGGQDIGGSNTAVIGIAASIIATAHNLGLQVIAIKIEKQEQASIMCSLDCDALQGYWVCVPKKPEDLTEILIAGGIEPTHFDRAA